MRIIVRAEVPIKTDVSYPTRTAGVTYTNTDRRPMLLIVALKFTCNNLSTYACYASLQHDIGGGWITIAEEGIKRCIHLDQENYGSLVAIINSDAKYRIMFSNAAGANPITIEEWTEIIL